MKFIPLALVLLAYCVLSASISEPEIGKITLRSDYKNVEGFREVDSYIRRLYPHLKYAKITQLATEVVAGMYYYTTYETINRKYDITVFYQARTETFRVTGYKVLAKPLNSE